MPRAAAIGPSCTHPMSISPAATCCMTSEEPLPSETSTFSPASLNEPLSTAKCRPACIPQGGKSVRTVSFCGCCATAGVNVAAIPAAAVAVNRRRVTVMSEILLGCLSVIIPFSEQRWAVASLEAAYCAFILTVFANAAAPFLPHRQHRLRLSTHHTARAPLKSSLCHSRRRG